MQKRAIRITIDGFEGTELIVCERNSMYCRFNTVHRLKKEGIFIDASQIKAYRDHRFDPIAQNAEYGEWIGWVRGYGQAPHGCLATPDDQIRRVIGVAYLRGKPTPEFQIDEDGSPFAEALGRKIKWCQKSARYRIGNSEFKTAKDVCNHLFGPCADVLELQTEDRIADLLR